MRFEFMTDMGNWRDSNEEEVSYLRSFFPEITIRVTNNDEDVTAEYLKTLREVLIYG